MLHIRGMKRICSLFRNKDTRLIYDKPYKSAEERIAILKERGLLFRNELEAISVLKHISYFRLSGYLIALQEKDGTYSQIYFEDAFELYRFDKKLRVLFLDAIETIEISWRTMIKNYLAEIDVFSLDNTDIFNTKTDKYNTFKKSREKNWKRSQEKFRVECDRRYQQPPVWKEMETWSMGCLRDCVFSLNSKYIRKLPCLKYTKTDGTFKSWLKALTRLRNSCAHHSRVWNGQKNSVDIPSGTDLSDIFGTISGENYKGKQNSTYTYCLIIWYLLKNIHPNTQWNIRLHKLISNFPAIVDKTHLKNMGFPDDWHTHDFWQL